MYIAKQSFLIIAPITLAAIIGFEAKDSNSKLPSRIQWPWSLRNKEDMLILGTSFDPDVSSTSPRCLWAAWTASSRFNTTCFQNSKSLYFSSSSQVCSQKCLDTTVAISKYMVEECGLESSLQDSRPVGYNHKDVVYLSWADQDLSRIVCNGPSSDNTSNGNWSDPGRCFSTVFSAETVRETSSLTNGQVDKDTVCNACTREWAKAIKSSKYKITPMLYYGHIPDAVRLASWISEQCDYQLTFL